MYTHNLAVEFKEGDPITAYGGTSICPFDLP